MNLYAIGLLALIFSTQVRAEESLLILKSPVRVVATYEDPQYEGKDCGLFSVTFSVSDASNTTSEKSMPLRCGDAHLSLKAQLRKWVSWRPPYLALHTNCGMSNGFNCDTQVIYSYRNAKLTRLGHVSHSIILSGHTFFAKYYTVIEYNSLVAHTGNPLPLVLRDTGSVLEFDPEMSWLLNRKHYIKFERLGLGCDPKMTGCDDEFKKAVVFNSTLAKLAGKQKELQSVLTKAKMRLSEQEFKQLTDMLVEVDDKGVSAYMAAEID